MNWKMLCEGDCEFYGQREKKNIDIKDNNESESAILPAASNFAIPHKKSSKAKTKNFCHEIETF